MHPIVTASRTLTMKRREEALVLGSAPYEPGNLADFDLTYDRLKVGMFALALAHDQSHHAFRLTLGGGTLSQHLELLEAVALGPGDKKVRCSANRLLILLYTSSAPGDVPLLGAGGAAARGVELLTHAARRSRRCADA